MFQKREISLTKLDGRKGEGFGYRGVWEDWSEVLWSSVVPSSRDRQRNSSFKTCESLEFVRKNLQPMAIDRIHNEFLLCYDTTGIRLCIEFALYLQQERPSITERLHAIWTFEFLFDEGRRIETKKLSRTRTCALQTRCTDDTYDGFKHCSLSVSQSNDYASSRAQKGFISNMIALP